jgi:cell division septal protein FtsQ
LLSAIREVIVLCSMVAYTVVVVVTVAIATDVEAGPAAVVVVDTIEVVSTDTVVQRSEQYQSA